MSTKKSSKKSTDTKGKEQTRKTEQYDPSKIEKKWQKEWEKAGMYKTQESEGKPKAYVLDMFPYPSGAGLHVGHPKGYIATDIYSRFKTMNGFNVLHPMGWDAFGLPAEEFAIKNKIHPSIATKQNVKRYKEQLSILGFNYDWDREVNTTDPEYYKWTQWAFLQMHKKGLTFESHEPINWCPSCKTGLANEDLEDGKCERCGSVVEKKPIRQWVIRITDYAERLLKDLDALDWPESIKQSQINWIGRSEGVNFKCRIKDLGIDVEMYNSVPQTYHAETFTAIAPEHSLVFELVKGTSKEKEVMDFVDAIKKKKSQNRFDVENDIEGIFTGRYIENFADTGKDLPIWVASYVLADYGTGMVNCSVHDERDFAFAKKYNIPLDVVMVPQDDDQAIRVKNLEYAYFKDPEGVLIKPTKFAGRKWGEVRGDIIEHIVSNGFGTRKINYKLRDWVFSRQRYWGEPIPLIHCAKCGVVPVPEKDLPLKLPEVKSYEPTGTGESPLAAIDKWVNTKCPQCKGPAKRETNTMPQWAGSCWYYLRYIDPKNKTALVDPKKEKTWQPVDMYVGGAEHATRHLIYARFWHKFLYDIGVVSTTEPFKQLKNQGLISGPDGRKMSKRYGNVVNPDDIVKLYGADTLRVYEMFMGPFDAEIAWSTENIIGSRRFLERAWRLFEKVSGSHKTKAVQIAEGNKELESLIHKTIKKVTDDINNFTFNTAISTMMILLNAFEKTPIVKRVDYELFIKLLAPFAPHVTDELWSMLGHKKSIHLEEWPIYDPEKLESGTYKIVVQINSKVRATFETVDIDEQTVTQKALSLVEISSRLEGRKPKRIVYVKGKLINIID
jgi:leucyl-tRNA synthetase